MPIPLFVATEKNRLYNRIEEIDNLKKNLAPKIVKALNKAGIKDGSITLRGDRFDTVRIQGERPDGSAPIIIEVKFAGARPFTPYVIDWYDSDGTSVIDSVEAQPGELIDTIEAIIDTMLRGEE